MLKRKLKKSKGLAAVFSLVSLITGFFFMDRSITGNVVLNGNSPSFDPLSFIGLCLVLCSGALALYVVKK